MKRWLLWHPESDCLFEEHSDEFPFGDGLVEDVTGIPEWEEKYEKQKQESQYDLKKFFEQNSKFTVRKKRCKECPFDRNSVRGFTSFHESRRGTYDSASAVFSLSRSPTFPCHLPKNGKHIGCRGAEQARNGDKEVLSTSEEFIKHHWIKR